MMHKTAFQKRMPHLLACAFLACMLAIPLVIQRRANGPQKSAQTETKASLSNHGFLLEEVAARSGLAFTHEAPTLDAKLAPIMPQVASMGAAVATGDFDRDGWDDLYVCNSGEDSQNRLFRNLRNGKFEDVAGTMGVANINSRETGVSMGAVWGDCDNDGFEDLLIYKWGEAELWLNKKGKRFVRAQNAGLPRWMNANSAVWLDFDRDGRLDLFLGGYYSEKLNLWKLATTRIMPESFEYAQNGGRKYLLRNMGGARFEDVTEKMGLNSRRWALAASAADINGTGYPDLFIANDYGVAELWQNQGGKKFRDIGRQSGVGAAPKSGMNVAWGDVFNTGELSAYVTNISEEGVLLQGNNLWVPRGKAKDGTPRYINMARESGVELGGWSFGAQFGDLNNDGHLDLYLTNGYISASNESYWYDYSKVAGGNTQIIGDAANWPPMKGRSLSGFQAKRVWLSDGAGRFNDVAQSVGATDRFDGRAVALGDFSNRGALDVVVANQRGPLLFYRNTVKPENGWIEFDLRGTKSNASAIGAQVTLFWNGKRQKQEVSGGSGFCSQNSRRLHFGIGSDARIERVEVRWPAGMVQTIVAPRVNQIHVIKEP
ncbi:MAG TPA: CRTAC1 family protein [Abditibacteriaceae bacterium]|jgi:hypothetical protein